MYRKIKEAMKNDGSSLIEVIAGVAILGFVLVSFSAMVGQAIIISSQADALTNGWTTVFNDMELLVLTSPDITYDETPGETVDTSDEFTGVEGDKEPMIILQQQDDIIVDGNTKTLSSTPGPITLDHPVFTFVAYDYTFAVPYQDNDKTVTVYRLAPDLDSTTEEETESE